MKNSESSVKEKKPKPLTAYQKNRHRARVYETISKQNDFLNEYPRQNFHLTNTCKAVGINKSTFYYWKEMDEMFAQQIDIMRDQEIDIIEDAFRELVQEKNPQIVMFGLKTRGAHRGYQEKQQVEHFGSGGIAIQINAPTNKAELRQVKEDGEEQKQLGGVNEDREMDDDK